jgi:SSS family transporter
MVQNATMLTIIMVCALGVFLYLGYLAGKKTSDSSSDYMAANGKMPYWLVTATLLATFICGATVMGGAGTAFEYGLFDTIPDPFGAALCLIAGGLVFQGIIRKTGAVSAAAVYQGRYGVSGAFVAGLCQIMPMLFFAGAQVAATGKLFQLVLGWPFTMTCILSGIFVIVYTAFGGITAVAWTDFVQVGLLTLGVIVLFPFVLGKLNTMGGHAAAVQLLGEDFFSMGNTDWSFTGIMTYLALWIGTSAGAMPGADIMSRGLIAKSPKTARWSAITAGIIMIGIGILVVLMGAWAHVFAENGLFTAEQSALIEEDAELMIPLLATHLLPSWFTALFFVGLLGAIMSSADSALFAPSTIISNDIIRPIYHMRTGKSMDDKKLLTCCRICVVILGIIATIFGTFTQSVFTLEVIGFTVQIVLFFPLTLALYWKKANRTGAIAGMIVGILWCVVMMVSQGTIDAEPYWVLCFGPAISGLIVQVIVSLATQKSDPPVPLCHRDGTPIKWPELGENRYIVE